ncbi:MAG: RluA family pseudouridine synthase [Actinomycetota bacterium]|nr:RluA family pseudouridine synthase [Actinomycetota bacterium]
MPEPAPPDPPVQRWPVPAALDGERVDRALALITGLSRREVNAVLDEGRVVIGRRAVGSHSRRVHTGEHLEVRGVLEASGPPPLLADPTVAFGIVHSDEAVVVVDKPAGLVVHPGHGPHRPTLVQGLLARFPDLAAMAVGASSERPGIVHRLDKGTSGLLVVARSPEGRDDLIAQLARREVKREYLALVFGHVDSDAGLIDAPLRRSDTDPSRIRVQIGGRPARTRYEVLDRFDHPVPSTLVRCRLETGRTHQIRVHLASIGHPVAGDDRYGGGARRGWPDLGPERPFLHAAALGFRHPSSGQACHFEAPLHDDLMNVLRQIGGVGSGLAGRV